MEFHPWTNARPSGRRFAIPNGPFAPLSLYRFAIIFSPTFLFFSPLILRFWYRFVQVVDAKTTIFELVEQRSEIEIRKSSIQIEFRGLAITETELQKGRPRKWRKRSIQPIAIHDPSLSYNENNGTAIAIRTSRGIVWRIGTIPLTREKRTMRVVARSLDHYRRREGSRKCGEIESIANNLLLAEDKGESDWAAAEGKKVESTGIRKPRKPSNWHGSHDLGRFQYWIVSMPRANNCWRRPRSGNVDEKCIGYREQRRGNVWHRFRNLDRDSLQ